MVSFADLNLSVNSQVKEIDFNGQKIEVKSYLPVTAKAGIINLAVRGSLSEGTVSSVLVDAYFHIFIVEYYTDIQFNTDDAEDILLNYDKIISNGLLDKILDAIPEEEYDYLLNSLKDFERQVVAYSQSYAGANSNTEELFKVLSQFAQAQKSN